MGDWRGGGLERWGIGEVGDLRGGGFERWRIGELGDRRGGGDISITCIIEYILLSLKGRIKYENNFKISFTALP